MPKKAVKPSRITKVKVSVALDKEVLAVLRTKGFNLSKTVNDALRTLYRVDSGGI